MGCSSASGVGFVGEDERPVVGGGHVRHLLETR
jgi:hypothetical protein